MNKEGLALPDHLDQTVSDLVDGLRNEWSPTNDEIVFECARIIVSQMEDIEDIWNKKDDLAFTIVLSQIIQFYTRFRKVELERIEDKELEEELGKLFHSTEKGLEKVAEAVTGVADTTHCYDSETETYQCTYKDYAITEDRVTPYPQFHIYEIRIKEVALQAAKIADKWVGGSNSLQGCKDIIDVNFDLDKLPDPTWNDYKGYRWRFGTDTIEVEAGMGIMEFHDVANAKQWIDDQQIVGIAVGNVIIPDGKITSIDDDLADAVKEMEEE